MDTARSTIYNLFHGEPSTYTRFSLAQHMEGDNSQVEMKLSNSEMDDEVGNSMGGHRDPRIMKPKRSPKSICFMIVCTLLIFLIGFLIGYLSYRGRMPTREQGCSNADSVSCGTIEELLSEDDSDTTLEAAQPVLEWKQLKELLKSKFLVSSFESRIRAFSANHEAGSEGDQKLALSVYNEFKNIGLDSVWNDEHYVKLQSLGSTPNKVTFLGSGIPEVIEVPKGYLAYSAAGQATGKLVYANYGREEDFKKLTSLDITVNGSVVIVRGGQISFAAKVANAQKVKAAAVLIYLDPADYNMPENTDVFGHVHLGTGDPYTPGFPSFNHTQFPPAQSSGLPSIPAQTITTNSARRLMSKMTGQPAPSEWKGTLSPPYNLGNDDNVQVEVEVNNEVAEKRILNVFGVVKGLIDPDHYVVIGAQRDSWGPGVAKSAVGTSLLVEMAKALSDLVVKDGYKPRRSIIFASWSAGDFGSVGATEWLEGYLSMLHLKAFAYINLDAAVLGSQTFKASASPMLYTLLGNTLKEVSAPLDSSKTLYQKLGADSWEKQTIVPMAMDDASYAFQAFSGIPSLSFRFTNDGVYPYFGTKEDNWSNLNARTGNRIDDIARAAANVAGQMVLRLTHDHQLSLDFDRYNGELYSSVLKINRFAKQLKKAGLTIKWLSSARGDFDRATETLKNDILNSDLNDAEMCRAINERIMRVEYHFLSPYVSPKDTPFRHIFYGSGPHTLKSLIENLNLLNVLLLECLIYLYGKLLIISVGSAIAPFKNVSVGDKIVCLNFGYGVK
ncbi:transferrin receptor protein 1-like isoform X1 [Acipenser ruthenus]|uniref:transferrin receptor protein 1-like isoform X1 n=1 Tax=Acipenser ruthenus TaxID=7906 RepID=UPI0027404ECB|nr:transferrin receptor protein 1-like isoform X1 [Acipenser ruthenus]